MTTRPVPCNRLAPHGRAVRITAIAAAVVALAATAGCEQQAAPRPAYEAPPPAPPAPLAGAPDAAPTAVAPDGAPPAGPADERRLPGALPGMPEPLPPPSAAPAEGSIPPEAAPTGSPPADQGLVAMAPIPNPEDGGPVPPRATAPPPRQHGVWAPPGGRRAHRGHRAHRMPAPVGPRAPVAPRPHAAQPPAKAAPVGHKPAAVAHPAKPLPAHHERRASRSELRQAAGGGSNTTAASNTTAIADARTEALRSALAGALVRGAVLTAPRPAGDQAAEATLVVPAGFYDTLKQEAGRQAMGDAAASANLDATLTGDGYAIIPGGAQAQPLRAGQPTTFRWRLTAPAGASGPLKADVSAELLGGGSQVLSLGAVQAQGQGGAPKWWGAALLALVVALGLGWLARSRGADARIAASRKRARRPDGVVNGQRSFDLGPRDGDPPR